MSGLTPSHRAPVPAPRRPSDPVLRATAYIHAGQLVVATRPTVITTVLGSCVAVCLFDAATGVGGMNHFLLPHQVDRERSLRFGAVAVPQLIEEVLGAGARWSSLRAKVFGGSSPIGTLDHRNLGEENAALALRLLAEAGIPVLERDLAGVRGRKLVFHSDDGSAWVRQL